MKGRPSLGVLPLEDLSPRRRRRIEEEEDGREKGSSSTKFASFLPFSIFLFLLMAVFLLPFMF